MVPATGSISSMYADEGDWAVRAAPGLGWEWISAADGLGRSLELRQSARKQRRSELAAQRRQQRHPWGRHSAASANIPPMILDVTHFPAVPHSTNSITILARIVDESASGLINAALAARRQHAHFGPSPVCRCSTRLSNDGTAGDGLYGVMLSPMANWASPSLHQGDRCRQPRRGRGRRRQQYAAAASRRRPSAFFQVDDGVYAGKQPVYRIVMRAGDRDSFFNNFDRVQRTPFITIEGSDVQIRHNCFARRRGKQLRLDRRP
jgi:hypothetical protein